MQNYAHNWIALLLLIYRAYSGITGLTKFFRSSYKKAWYSPSTNPIKSQHIAIEMNPLLHSNVRYCKSPAHFVAKVCSSLDHLLEEINPTETLIFVFDGPAPFAKLQTQRNRRESSPESSLLTPGTDFMDSMCDLVLFYILQRIKRPKFQNIKVYISGSRCPGEGELKIVNWVNTIMPNPTDSLIVCGTDSDLLIQAINFPSVDNLIIYQYGSDNSNMFCEMSMLTKEIGKGILSLSSADDSNKNISKVPMPKNKTMDYFKSGYFSSKQFRLDIAFLFIIHGNDYLPKLRGVNFGRSLYVYSEILQASNESLINIINLENNTFNLPMLMKFFQILSKFEDDNSVPLLSIPSLSEAFNKYTSRNFPGFLPVWNYTSNILQGTRYWTACIDFSNVNYTSANHYISRKGAREEIIYSILSRSQPMAISELEKKQAQKKEFIKKVKEDVINESNIRKENFIRIASQYTANPDIKAINKTIPYQFKIYSDFESFHLDPDSQSEIFKASNGVSYEIIRDSDVEEYLRGLLWVLKMYSDGICPDIGYTFSSRFAPAPSRIVRYLLAHTDDALFKGKVIDGNNSFLAFSTSSTNWLHGKLVVPCSNLTSLSAEATSACVIPIEGGGFVSKKIYENWQNVQSYMKNLTYDENLSLSLNKLSYSELLDLLEEIWESKTPKNPVKVNPLNVTTGLHSHSKDNLEKFDSFNSRIDSIKSDTSSNTNNNETKKDIYPKKSIFADKSDKSWVVITPEVNNYSKISIKGKYLRINNYDSFNDIPQTFKIPPLPEGLNLIKIPIIE